MYEYAPEIFHILVIFALGLLYIMSLLANEYPHKIWKFLDLGIFILIVAEFITAIKSIKPGGVLPDMGNLTIGVIIIIYLMTSSRFLNNLRIVWNRYK